MTAIELISNAFYLSGIVSRGLESVDDSQLSDGLRMLNDILAEKSAKTTDIPYYDIEYQLTAVEGQEKYHIDGLVSVEEFTYNIGDIRYSATDYGRSKYFGTPRANNISSLPFSYHFERSLNGGDIYLYFLPIDAYNLNITGKFSFPAMTAQSNLYETLERFYVSYLVYELAKRVCDFYNFQMPAQAFAELQEQKRNIFSVEPPDLTVKKISLLNSSNDRDVNYGIANLGTGFLP